MHFITIALGWFLYFAIHSLLATNKIKKLTELNFPFLFNYYRIIYNIIAISGLLVLIRITIQDQNKLFNENKFITLSSVLLCIAGIIILAISFYSFDKMEFLGLKKEAKNGENKLIINGIYKHIRHPLYTGTILLLTGLFLHQPTLSFLAACVLSFIYIEIGSILEEKKLILEFGDAYIQYSLKVKKYFPLIY